jgi:hypothetical protein
MSDITALEKGVELFPYSRWNQKLPLLADQYRRNSPVPHIFLTEFLQPEMAAAVSKEFPAVGGDTWTHWQHHNENKHGMTKLDLFPPLLRALTEELNSPKLGMYITQVSSKPYLRLHTGQ